MMRLLSAVACALLLVPAGAFTAEDEEADLDSVEETTEANTTEEPGRTFPWCRRRRTDSRRRRSDPKMECDLNCYGAAATPVDLHASRDVRVDLETCRELCLESDQCEAIVWGRDTCWGKKDVKTALCQHSNGEFVTEMMTRFPQGTCIIMGDPHVQTFDNALGFVDGNRQSEAGDYILIKSGMLNVQGRFGYSNRFPALASLVGLAVTGELLKGQKLTVEFRGPPGQSGFKAWWNDVEILTWLGSHFESADGILSATKAMMDPDHVDTKARHTIGGVYGSGELPSFSFKIANSTEIYIVLGTETMNAVITMQRVPGDIDGYCGNFNCLSKDDTMPELKKRGFVSPLATSSFAFPPVSAVKRGELTTKSVTECSRESLEKAEEACKNMANNFKEGCIYDVCTSGSKSMGKEDVMTADVAKEMEDKSLTFAGLHFPRLTGASLASSAQWLIAIAVMGLAGCGLVAGLSSRRPLRGLAPREGRDVFLKVSSEDDDEEAFLLSAPAPSEREPVVAAE